MKDIKEEFEQHLKDITMYFSEQKIDRLFEIIPKRIVMVYVVVRELNYRVCLQ